MPDGAFFEQFIDDYFSECDEHSRPCAACCSTLDADRGRPHERMSLQDLSRALHTLKGLSGMVGLSAAEADRARDGRRACARSPRRAAVPIASSSKCCSPASAARSQRSTRGARATPIPSADAYVEQVRDARWSRPAARDDVGALASTLHRRRRPRRAVPVRVRAVRRAGGPRRRRRDDSSAPRRARRHHVDDAARAARRAASRSSSSSRSDGAAPDETWREDGLTWESDDRCPRPIAVAHRYAPSRRRAPPRTRPWHRTSCASTSRGSTI